MRSLPWMCLLLAGCALPEITSAGSQVRVTTRSEDVPAGCRVMGTIEDAEGGGLRSFDENRHAAETQLRNEAGRLGGNTVAMLEEARGDTDEGLLHFQAGIPGMTTPNTGCTNCVMLKARVLQCEGGAAPTVAARPLPLPSAPSDDCVRKQPAAAPPPAANPMPYAPAPAVTVIILPPPQVFLPPPPSQAPPPPAPPPRDSDDFRR